MRELKHFPLIDREKELYGLELTDYGIILFVSFLLFLPAVFINFILGFAVFTGSFVTLFTFLLRKKRGKPRGWLMRKLEAYRKGWKEIF